MGRGQTWVLAIAGNLERQCCCIQLSGKALRPQTLAPLTGLAPINLMPNYCTMAWACPSARDQSSDPYNKKDK